MSKLDIVRHSKKKWSVGAMTFKTKTAAQKYCAEQAAAPQVKPSKTKAPKGPSKVERVIVLCQKGCTLDEITSALSISKAASASLIGDARRKGIDIKSEKSPAGVNVYRAC